MNGAIDEDCACKRPRHCKPRALDPRGKYAAQLTSGVGPFGEFRNVRSPLRDRQARVGFSTSDLKEKVEAAIAGAVRSRGSNRNCRGPGSAQAHFIMRSAATNSGRMIHLSSPSPASSSPAAAIDRANHQRTGPLPFCGGA
jgi:hypothetical protein